MWFETLTGFREESPSLVRERQHLLAGILVVLAFGATALAYYFHLRFSILRSNPWVWSTFTGISLCGLLYSVWTTTRLFRRKVIAWPLGWFLLTTTPWALTAGVTWELTVKAHARDNVDISKVRILSCWCCGAGELEAWWRYPRRIQTKHIELIDADTTPNAQLLTRQLDEHIERMASQLGQPIPAGHIAWVRGTLLGFGKENGRAIRSLAICDEGPGELTYVDYHEVAHALIFRMAGPDGYPPRLLIEGWAQCNSAPTVEEDRRNAILGLAEEYRAGNAVPLCTLVAPDYYGRSYGPVYTYGAPFTVYLLETYGGETFFRLYRQCTQPTFFQDVKNILGVSWDTLESDFWAWFDKQVDELPPNSEQSANRRHSIILNEGVNPDAWGFLLKNVNRNQFTIEKLPETYAFAKESKNDENGQSRFQFFRDTDSSFGRWSESTEWQGWTLNSPRRKTSLEKKGDRYVETETYDEPMESYAQRQDKDIIVYIGDGCFARLLELDRNSETMYPTTIDSVRGPFDQSLWEVSYSKAVNEEQTVLVECVLDADQDWRVVKSTISGWLDDTVVTTETTYAKWFGQRIPHEFTRVRKKPDGSSSWRTSIRPLAPAVAEEIKADVLREIDRGPDPPTWRERLSHRVRGPAILKYGWPSFAAILLVGSRLRRTKPT